MSRRKGNSDKKRSLPDEIQIGKRYKFSYSEPSSDTGNLDSNILLQYSFKPANLSNETSNIIFDDEKKECIVNHQREGDNQPLEFRGVKTNNKDFGLAFNAEKQTFSMNPIAQSFVDLKLKSSDISEKLNPQEDRAKEVVTKRLKKLVQKRPAKKPKEQKTEVAVPNQDSEEKETESTEGKD
jgi:hypothetical protein